MCRKEFSCTRKSPLCATEKSRGFKRSAPKDKTEYINGTWTEQLKKNIEAVDYTKLVPDKKFKQCICYSCLNCLNTPVGKSITSLFIEENTELLHFYFGSTKELGNQIFPKDVPIIVICYGIENITIEKL